MFGRAAGIAAFVWAAGQAGGDAAKSHGLDAATASIICAAIAGAVAVAVALIGRPRPTPPSADEDAELVKLALLVALRGHDAERDGDEELAAEQQLLAKHLGDELERRRRGPE